jgi:hypothetical protein
LAKPPKDIFDPKKFLARVGAGKTILELPKNRHVFQQGDVADSVFTFRKAKSSSRSYLSRARKRSSQFWSQANSLARDA